MSEKIPFTRRLKEARTRKELSQKQLGVAAGIDEFSASARMNQYEKGTHTPDLTTVEHIANALEVPTAYLFAIEDDLAEFILKYAQLDEEQKNNLMEELSDEDVPPEAP